jgi:hypothetical protein
VIAGRAMGWFLDHPGMVVPALVLPTQVVAQFAASPDGVLTTRQLARLGFDRREVALWAFEGLIERVMHGMYVDPSLPVPPVRSVLLPLRYLDLRRPAAHHPPAVSGEAALAVHRAEGFELPIDPLVLVDHRCRARVEGYPFTIRRTDLTDVETIMVGRVRTVRPWRAVADAALNADVTERRLRVAIDHLRYRGLLDIVQAATRWASLDHAGGRRMAAMVASGDFEQESEGERDAFRLLFGRGGAPLPDCQVTIVGRRRADFTFLHAGLIAEYLGGVHDGKADEAASRIAEFEQLGHRVLLLSRSMLRNPERHAARIEAVRRERLARIRDGSLPLPPLPPQPPRLTPLRTLLPPGQLPRGHRRAA